MSLAVTMIGPASVVGIGFVNPYVTRETNVLSGATVQCAGTSPTSAGRVGYALLPVKPKLLQVSCNGSVQLPGLGLLLAGHLTPRQRKSTGWSLFLIGAASTVPLAAS